MNKRKEVSYRPAGESQFTWIKKDKNSNSAFCKVWQVFFQINNSGLSQVEAHGNTKAQKDKEPLLSGKTSERVLISKGNEINLSEERSSFTDQVVKAETLQALYTVSSNHRQAQTRIMIS